MSAIVHKHFNREMMLTSELKAKNINVDKVIRKYYIEVGMVVVPSVAFMLLFLLFWLSCSVFSKGCVSPFTDLQYLPAPAIITPQVAWADIQSRLERTVSII